MARHLGSRAPRQDSEPQGAILGAESLAQATPNPGSEAPSLAHDVLRLLAKLALVVVGFLVLFSFVFGLYRVGDGSMQPSFKDGDLVMFYRLDRTFVAGEVAVVEYEGRMMCGRVVATSGDEVDIDSQGLLVNGSYQFEPDITEDTTQVVDGVTFPLTVPEGSVFLLGDNRTSAVDSRIYGCVSDEDVQGKVMGLFRLRGF